MNGYASEKPHPREDVKDASMERRVINGNARKITLANVRSLGAKFEAKASEISVDKLSTSSQKLKKRSDYQS